MCVFFENLFIEKLYYVV